MYEFFGCDVFIVLYMLFFIFVALICILNNIYETIDDFKEKRKLEKDNKN